MNLKLNSPSFLKKVALCFMLASTATGIAQIDTHEVGDMGYLCTPMESTNGIIATNNRYSEIYVLKNNELTPILKANNCGPHRFRHFAQTNRITCQQRCSYCRL